MTESAVEVGRAVISVLPSMQGFNKALTAEVNKVGASAGKSFGQAFSDGAADGIQDLKELERELEVSVKKTAKAVEAARETEEEATRKLAIEEAKLNDLRAKGKATTAQTLTAEDRVIKARKTLANVQRGLSAATAEHTQAQESANKELTEAQSAAARAEKSYKSLGARIKDSLSGATNKGSFSKIAVDAGKGGTSAGNKFSDSFGDAAKSGMGKVGSALKGGLVGVAAGAVAGVGLTVAKGFTRLDSIDQATGKLRGLGYEAKAIDGIMQDSLKAVRGTAFGLDEASSAAAGALAAGIEQGPALEKYLRLVGDSATIAGTDFQSMGSIFNKVASKGALDGEVLAQLSDAGILGLADLGKHYGVSATEAQKMVSEGKVSFNEFSTIMKDKVGGAAAESGKTFQGGLKNMMASVGRIGANLLAGIFPQMKNGLSGITEILGPIEAKAKVWGANIGKVVADVSTIIGPYVSKIASGFRSLVSSFTSGDLGAKFAAIKAALVPVVQQVMTFALKAAPFLVSAFRAIAQFVTTQFVPAVAAIGSKIGVIAKVVLPILKEIGDVLLKKLRDNWPQILSAFNSAKSIILDVMTIVRTQIARVTAVISFIWSRWGTQIKATVGSTFSLIISIISGAFKIVAGLFKIITGVMTGDMSKAKAGLRMIWDGIKGIFLGVLRNLATLTNTWFGKLINGAITKARSLLTWLGSSFKNGLAKVKEYILAPIRAARDGLSTLLGAGKSGVRSIFTNAVSGIKGAWNGLKAIAAKPIVFMIDTVIGGLVGAFNKVVGLLPGGGKLKITAPGVPAGLKGFHDGGYTGKIHPRSIAGVVHGDEQVIPSKSRRKIEKSNPGALDYMTRFGRMPGFFNGGRVPLPGANSIKRHGSGYPWARWSGDLNAPNDLGKPIVAWMDGVVASVKHMTSSYGKHVRINHGGSGQTLSAHMSRVAVSAGQAVKAGQTIGYVGSTGNSSGPHLHWELKGGNAPIGGGSADSGAAPSGMLAGGLSKIKEMINGPLDKMKSFGNSPLENMLKTVPKGIVDGMINKAKDILPSFDDISGAVSGAVDNFKAGVGVARWTPEVLTALKMVGQSAFNLPRTLRRMNQESGGNPKAINNYDINARNGVPSKGLMQVIDPTFAAYRDKSLPNDIWNPLSNIVASMRYAMSRYGSLSAAYDKSGGYANGTRNAKRGLHWVGEQGPELLSFKGGETVIPNGQSMALANNVSRVGAQAYSPSSPSDGGDIYVTVVNPFTGEELLQRVGSVADSRINSTVASANYARN